MLIDNEELDHLVTLASAAPTDPSRWPEFLQALQQRLGATGSSLFTPEPDPEGRLLTVFSGTAETSLPEYLGSWVLDDPWNEAARVNRFFNVAGEVRTGSEALEQTHLRRTGFYNDFLCPHEIEHLVSLKVCDATDGTAPPTHLSFHAPRKTAGFGDEHKRLLRAVWPHLQRAVQTHWALARAQSSVTLAEAALDALSHPAWLVRKDATIEHANVAARHALSSGQWVTTRGQKLHALGDLDQHALLSAIDQASHGGGRAWVAALLLAGRLQRAVLRVVDVSRQQGFAAFWRHAQALLVLELPADEDLATVWMAKIASHYRLTPAECGVLRKLSLGMTPSTVADELNLSITTVRSHMRAVFGKTGCRRQADLVRLASGR